MIRIIVPLYTTILVLFLSSCVDNSIAPLNTPTIYDSTQYSHISSSTIKIRADVKKLLDTIKSARINGSAPDSLTLFELLKPFSTLGTSTFQNTSIGYIQEFSKTNNGMYNPRLSIAENKQGGVFAGRVFDENGLEYQEIIEKLCFGNLFYHMASRLSLHDSTTHLFIALFGANPSFPNSDITPSNPDVFSAAYAARRDKNDGNGFYTNAKKELIRLQAAIKAGTNYNEDALSARKQFFTIWEQSLMASAISYCYAAHAKFILTNPTDADIASGLHAINEAIGFVLAYKGVSEKLISDTELDTILSLLHSMRPSLFITDAYNTTPDILKVIGRIQMVYGFSSQQLEDFKINWVTVQNRK
jgi:hypothetical protein